MEIFLKKQNGCRKCYESKPYNNLDELVSKMMKIFENIEKERHLEILNSHPDLAVEKKLTKDSKNEQKNASLNQCTDKEFVEFKKLNKEYKKNLDSLLLLLSKEKIKKKF